MILSIIILNYKTKGLLRQCLQGIQDCQLPMEHEVIVVDGHSGDGSVEMVRQLHPRVQLIAAEQNLGFGGGMNIGMRRAQGQYIMLLNPDVAVFRGAVEALVEYMEQHPRVGISAPKLTNPDGTTQLSCFLFPTWPIPILRRSPLGRLPVARSLLERYLMSTWGHHEPRPVGWLLGACLMVRASALAEFGLFDERFFLYFEDVDICRRSWQAGWEVHYAPQADMVHFHQRLSAKSGGLSALFAYPTRVHIHSGIKYFKKYFHSTKPPHSL